MVQTRELVTLQRSAGRGLQIFKRWRETRKCHGQFSNLGLGAEGAAVDLLVNSTELARVVSSAACVEMLWITERNACASY